MKNDNFQYRCVKQGCTFIGSRTDAHYHVIKEHAPLHTVPFYCTLCGYRCFRQRQLENHVTKWHRHLKLSSGSIKDDVESLCKSTTPYEVSYGMVDDGKVDLVEYQHSMVEPVRDKTYDVLPMETRQAQTFRSAYTLPPTPSYTTGLSSQMIAPQTMPPVMQGMSNMLHQPPPLTGYVHSVSVQSAPSGVVAAPGLGGQTSYSSMDNYRSNTNLTSYEKSVGLGKGNDRVPDYARSTHSLSSQEKDDSYRTYDPQDNWRSYDQSTDHMREGDRLLNNNRSNNLAEGSYDQDRGNKRADRSYEQDRSNNRSHDQGRRGERSSDIERNNNRGERSNDPVRSNNRGERSFEQERSTRGERSFDQDRMNIRDDQSHSYRSSHDVARDRTSDRQGSRRSRSRDRQSRKSDRSHDHSRDVYSSDRKVDRSHDVRKSSDHGHQSTPFDLRNNILEKRGDSRDRRDRKDDYQRSVAMRQDVELREEPNRKVELYDRRKDEKEDYPGRGSSRKPHEKKDYRKSDTERKRGVPGTPDVKHSQGSLRTKSPDRKKVKKDTEKSSSKTESREKKGESETLLDLEEEIPSSLRCSASDAVFDKKTMMFKDTTLVYACTGGRDLHVGLDCDEFHLVPGAILSQLTTEAVQRVAQISGHKTVYFIAGIPDFVTTLTSPGYEETIFEDRNLFDSFYNQMRQSEMTLRKHDCHVIFSTVAPMSIKLYNDNSKKQNKTYTLRLNKEYDDMQESLHRLLRQINHTIVNSNTGQKLMTPLLHAKFVKRENNRTNFKLDLLLDGLNPCGTVVDSWRRTLNKTIQRNRVLMSKPEFFRKNSTPAAEVADLPMKSLGDENEVKIARNDSGDATQVKGSGENAKTPTYHSFIGPETIPDSEQISHVVLKSEKKYTESDPTGTFISKDVTDMSGITVLEQSLVSRGRSSILEDYKNHKINVSKIRLSKLCGHVIQFVCDTQGSRLVQAKFTEATDDEKAMVFNEILPVVCDLIKHPVGSFFMQKMIELADEYQHRAMTQRLLGIIVPLSKNIYANHVLQKAMEAVPYDLKIEIAKEVSMDIFSCCNDRYGNHVVQCCIRSLQPGGQKIFVDLIMKQFLKICTSPYGRHVVECILDHCSPVYAGPVFEELLKHLFTLIHDVQGNDLIICVIRGTSDDKRTRIIQKVLSQILPLSCDKHGSMVVGKCVMCSSKADRAMLVSEVCTLSAGSEPVIKIMAEDLYGQNVVNKMLEYADSEQRKIIQQKIGHLKKEVRCVKLKQDPERSLLLKQFLIQGSCDFRLNDIVNHVVEFSQDQIGSKFIQVQLKTATLEEKLMVFNEIRFSAALNLMTHIFGNYVIQKLYEFCNDKQRQSLTLQMIGHILKLSCDQYGSRCVQAALQWATEDLQIKMVKEWDGHVMDCINDRHGNFCIQKAIETVKPEHLQNIFIMVENFVLSLSTHPHGCRIIQQIIERWPSEQICSIIEDIINHLYQLVCDEYGNYLVQHVITHGTEEQKSNIVNKFKGRVIRLSQHKFASNVIEKCVAHCSAVDKAWMIQEVFSYKVQTGPESALLRMLKDQYGNYVLKTMLTVANPVLRKCLVSKIKPYLTSLKKENFAKQIVFMVESELLG